MASNLHTLIVADGDIDVPWLASLVADHDPDSPLMTIAADGGAVRAAAAGIELDLVVGDFDSLGTRDRAALLERGVAMLEADADKDESDMELCLLAALDAGAARVTIVGALGGSRPEHSVANLLLLADPRLDGLDVAVVDRASRISRMGSTDGPGDRTIDGTRGDYVSLFPIGGPVAGVTTHGLRFPLADEALAVGPSRGLSNELIDRQARVTSRRGCLLVVHTNRSDA